MELSEFARQIVETDDLEAKLRAPAVELSDERPGPSLPAPAEPGRPPALRIRPKPGRAAMPGIHRLERDPEARGMLLHFFANHELLATELMALVLLRFPRAPAEFRRGVLTTLLEEQRHTRMYLARMEDCGVRFGDLPVSGYFWNAVAPMETPMDYVTRLSLTFEQANLDYSRHYAGIFRAIGDLKTAAILDRIQRDEIAHVGYGLEWFRRWKREGESDWEAFSRHLVYPLSPSRAKAGGMTFNAQARRGAGLDEDFIGRLELFERSRGRTPRVHWFAPDEESAMASGLEGKGYHPRTSVEDLAADLEILVALLARRDDLALVREIPSPGHLGRLRDCGLVLPEFEALAADGSLQQSSLTRSRKLGGLCPWSWGPHSARLLAPLLPNLPGGRRSIADFWNPQRRFLFSKASGLELLERFAARTGSVPPEIIGTLCVGADEIADALDRLARAGFARAVLKAPFACAGRGNRFVSLPWRAADPALPWAKSVLARQGALVVEPALARVLDFSVHYDCEAHRDTVRLRGIVRLVNDPRGRFVAAATGPKSAQGLPRDVAAFFVQDVLAAYEADAPLPRLLRETLRESDFTGPLGIDAFVYREGATGALRLKPVVEINPRYTMGRVALELRRFVSSGRCLALELAPARAPLPANPPLLDARGKIHSGTLALTDPARARHRLAFLHVAARMQELPSHSCS